MCYEFFQGIFYFLAIFVVNSKVRRLLKNTSASKMKFSVEDFCRISAGFLQKLRIWSHILKKPLMENFIFCAVISLQ